MNLNNDDMLSVLFSRRAAREEKEEKDEEKMLLNARHPNERTCNKRIVNLIYLI